MIYIGRLLILSIIISLIVVTNYTYPQLIPEFRNSELVIYNQTNINTNNTCEKCNKYEILNDHISVKCVGNKNTTCKIYYEICNMVSCPIETFNSTDYIIQFNGQLVRIPRMYILLFAVCILYLALPFQQIRRNTVN